MYVNNICQLLFLVLFCVFTFDRVNGNNNDLSFEGEKTKQNIFHHDVAKNCTYERDCGRWGHCKRTPDGSYLCECRQGASGENCETVDQCASKQVDCDSDDSAECVLGDGGKAYCKCKDTLQYYDDRDERCFDCDCGNSSVVDECFLKNGKKICSCDFGYYNKDGKCQDCECGENSIGCSLKNGIKICLCYGGYAIKEGVCEECECEEGAICHFEGDQKTCSCKPGFIPSGTNGTCLRACNATYPCQNGGTCEREVCSCLNGTSGSLCREIAGCRGWKCLGADCLFDVNTLEAYCHCEPPLHYDDYHEQCLECDCGEQQKSCEYKHGWKRCTCWNEYQDKQGKCTTCSCNKHYSDCTYDLFGNKICKCDKGYIQIKDECIECNCGDGGKCEFDLFDNKICTCNENYTYNGKVCEYCDCGKNGTCAFHQWTKYCSCDEGYTSFEGKCQECECGKNAECRFTSSGEKDCKCRAGYEMNSGVCERCDCGLEGSNCSYVEGAAQCQCPEGYSEARNSTDQARAFCGVCDCGLEGSNCTYVNITTRCQCPEGYVESWNTTDRLNATCEDVDECLLSGACPSSTNCINRPGSYECVCKEGYKEPALGADYIKTEGCEGSHPWKTAGIVIGCVLGVGLLIGLAVIGKKYGDN